MLQTGALRAGEASAEWDKSSRIREHLSTLSDHLGLKSLSNALVEPYVEDRDVKDEKEHLPWSDFSAESA